MVWMKEELSATTKAMTSLRVTGGDETAQI